MSTALDKAVLTISVDLDWAGADTRIAGQRSFEAMTDRLLEVCARHEVPATWAISDPTAAAAQRIMARDRRHEIALWIDPPDTRLTSSPREALHDLSARIAAARLAGLALTTLALASDQAAVIGPRADREGITAMRHAALDEPSRTPLQPHRLRFGPWSFPLELSMPGDQRWIPGGGNGRAARRAIARAIAQRGLVQLAVDAQRLVARGYAAQRVLDRVLAQAVWFQRQGSLDIATIGSTAAQLSARCESVPSRSILRPAA